MSVVLKSLRNKLCTQVKYLERISAARRRTQEKWQQLRPATATATSIGSPVECICVGGA